MWLAVLFLNIWIILKRVVSTRRCSCIRQCCTLLFSCTVPYLEGWRNELFFPKPRVEFLFLLFLMRWRDCHNKWHFLPANADDEKKKRFAKHGTYNEPQLIPVCPFPVCKYFTYCVSNNADWCEGKSITHNLCSPKELTRSGEDQLTYIESFWTICKQNRSSSGSEKAERMCSELWFSKCDPQSAASALPGSLLGTQIFRPQPRPTKPRDAMLPLEPPSCYDISCNLQIPVLQDSVKDQSMGSHC